MASDRSAFLSRRGGLILSRRGGLVLAASVALLLASPSGAQPAPAATPLALVYTGTLGTAGAPYVRSDAL